MALIDVICSWINVSVTLVCSRQTLCFAIRMARHATNIKKMSLAWNLMFFSAGFTIPTPSLFHPECATNCHDQMLFAFVDIETISDLISIEPESDQCIAMATFVSDSPTHSLTN